MDAQSHPPIATYPLWTPSLAHAIVVVALQRDYLKPTATVPSHYATATRTVQIFIKTFRAYVLHTGLR